MKDYSDILIRKETCFRSALAQINKHAAFTRTLFITDSAGILLGSLSDGDIRRALLAGKTLEDSVASKMNINCISLRSAFPREQVYEKMQESSIDAIPIVNSEGKIEQIILASELVQNNSKRQNIVLIMAGGLGTRLAPLTEATPKPMLNVGGKPILENIVNSFIDQGFQNIVLSVNYKSEQIKEYFSDGKNKGVKISYIEETTRMGTAGSISLLKEKPDSPFIVCNADLLTKINYNSLLDWHTNLNSTATICVKNYEFEIPYGVVLSFKHKVKKIIEKPKSSYWANAGIYVLDPECLNLIPNHYFDMTDLLEKLINKKKSVSSFPLGAYWTDIGEEDDYTRAKIDFKHHFESDS